MGDLFGEFDFGKKKVTTNESKETESASTEVALTENEKPKVELVEEESNEPRLLISDDFDVTD